MEWKVHQKNLCVKLHSITLTDFERKETNNNYVLDEMLNGRNEKKNLNNKRKKTKTL